MPSYIHAWCSDCMKKGGCGNSCVKLPGAKGPPGCTTACTANDNISKMVTADSAFTTLHKPVDVTVTGLTVESDTGTLSLTYGCTGSPGESGSCKSGRCAHIEYATAGTSGCNVFLPDGYESHGDPPLGTGVEYSDAANLCGCGGSATSSSCEGGNHSEFAFHTLINEWMEDDDEQLPDFFCQARTAPLCLDPSYVPGDGDGPGTSACPAAPARWCLFATMDGGYDQSADSAATPEVCDANGDAITAWPFGETKIVIRQTELEATPYAYVSILYYLRIVSIGAIGSPCTDSGSQGDLDNINTFHPLAWRVTYRKALSSACDCLPTGTYDYYSSSFHSGCSTNSNDRFESETCQCEHVHCTYDFSQHDCHGLPPAETLDCIENYCDGHPGECGASHADPPCDDNTDAPCWAICDGGEPDLGNCCDNSNVHYCTEATPLPGCNKATLSGEPRGCINNSNSFWNDGVPNISCDPCNNGYSMGGCCGDLVGTIPGGEGGGAFPMAAGYNQCASFTVSSTGTCTVSY